jgi:hypothetical protein
VDDDPVSVVITTSVGIIFCLATPNIGKKVKPQSRGFLHLSPNRMLYLCKIYYMDFKIAGKDWHVPTGIINTSLVVSAFLIGMWVGDMRADIDCNKENSELRIDNKDLTRQLDDCQTV